MRSFQFVLVSVLYLAIGLFSCYNCTAEDLKEFYISCSQSEFDSIYSNYDQDIYIDADLNYNGQTWSNLRMRIRGSGTRTCPKKSLKLKFDNEPFANGRSTLNLNAEYEDPTYMRNALASRIFRDLGVPCYETDYAKVYINNQNFGLYVLIENVDEEFLTSRNMLPIGNLYKASNDGACLAPQDVFADVWEKKTNEGADSADFEQFRYRINTVQDKEFYAFAQNEIDYDKMLTIIAGNWLILNGSTYYHNYYLYHYPGLYGKWAMLPWDMDKSFSKNSLFRSVTLSTEPWYPDNPFLERALLDENIVKDLRAKVDEIYNRVINKDYLFPIMDSTAAFIREAVLNDPKDAIESEAQWLDAINYDKYIISNRYEQVCEQLERCPASFRVIPTEEIVPSAPLLKWHPSASQINQPITYTVYYSTDRNYPEDKTTKIENITDTTYQIPDNFDKTKTIYWRVEAKNGDYTTEGYNNFNYFRYKEFKTLPCDISGEYILTQHDSPYLVDCKLNVHSGGKLIAQPGAAIYFAKGSMIYVTGELSLVGTKENPITIRPAEYFQEWNLFKIENAKKAEFSNCNVKDIQLQVVNTPTSYTYNNIQATKPLEGILVNTDHSKIDFSHNKIYGINSGEGVIHFYCSGNTDYNVFESLDDELEIICCNPMSVTNNTFSNAGDDAIDMNNCFNINIENNYIRNIADKGITAGDLEGMGSDTILIRRNVIINCRGAALNAKNGSHFVAENNTLVDNEDAVLLNQVLESATNTSVKVRNCIFSSSKGSDVWRDDNSSIDIDYCISDKFGLSGGEHCLFGEIGFVDAFVGDFRLDKNSICIDAGDPETEPDRDGTVADIGAFDFEQANNRIVINEINYKSGNNISSDDWIELYNCADEDVDLSGWILKDSDDSHGFVIPNNTILAADDYLILAQTAEKFKNEYSYVQNVVGNFTFGLSSTADEVRLFNANNVLVDSVGYLSVEPWNTNANGTGGTLQLINPQNDNSRPESWIAFKGIATPGVENITSGIKVIESGSNVYPQPANNCVHLKLTTDNANAEVEYVICNEIGYTIKTGIARLDSRSELTLNLAEIPSGVYFVIINDNKADIFKFVKQ